MEIVIILLELKNGKGGEINMSKAYTSGASIQFWRGGTWSPGTYIEKLDREHSKVMTQMGIEKMHNSKIKLKW